MKEKGYIVHDYWNHKILGRVVSWKDADKILKAAIKNRGTVQADWFGIEAVENIHSTALKKNPRIMQAPELPQSKHATRKPKPQAPALPKKNPVHKYFLHVQRKGGQIMTWNGERFTTNEPFKAFDRATVATQLGKKMVRQYPILSTYKVWVAGKFITLPVKNQKTRAMRGGSKSPKANPSPRANAELDAAAKKLEDFSGHPVQHLESAYSRSSQKTGLIIGELDLIGYRARRDGKTERYGHTFKKNSRPLLAVTSDGKQLHIVGGQYEFTEAGIEDR